MEKIWRFLKDEEGTETVEWALVGGLVIAAAAAAWVLIGGKVTTQINRLEAALP